MPLPIETDSSDDPPIELTVTDKTNLVAIGVTLLVLVVLVLLGFRCAVHRIGSEVAFLMS